MKITSLKAIKTHYSKIINCAEALGKEFISNSCVDPLEIASFYKIKVHEKGFEDSFSGCMCYHKKSDRFHIFINRNCFDSKNDVRARFTIAHELGHYFIDRHNLLLKNGESLTYHKNNYYYLDYPHIETEASIFAANLLMPKEDFSLECNKCNVGFETILSASKAFNTSIISSVYHYVNTDQYPCIFLWLTPNNKLKKETIPISESFKKILKQDIAFKYHPDRSRSDIVELSVDEQSSYGITQSITNLSAWALNINQGSSNDMVIVEQIFQYGLSERFVLLFPTEY